MIKTDRGYRITKSFLAKYQRELTSIDDDGSIRAKALCDAVKGRIDDLSYQLTEYDQMKQLSIPFFSILQMNELLLHIIKARIALNLTQKQFANLIGVKEQQIQRWEQHNYQEITVSKLLAIIDCIYNALSTQKKLIPHSLL